MTSFLRLRASSFLLSSVLLTLPAQLSGQSATPAKGAGPTTTTASGFSIETEMLTYRALESNGEAIACDVAAYLYGTKTDFKNLPSGVICNVGDPSGASPGVILLPFERSVFADFQVWRSDMQTMAEFEERGQEACKAAASAPPPNPNAPAPPPTGRGLTKPGGGSAAGAASAIMGMMPGGNMVSAASGVLGLFASSHEASPVGGTIEDQAFMDNVSRELRAVNIGVLMPSVYGPYALTSIDRAHSPFLTSLDKLLQTRDCLVASKGKDDENVKNIEEFLAVLSGPTAPPAKPAANASGAAAASSAPRSGATGAAAAPAAEPAGPSHSHLEAVLTADGLAQRLGADAATGNIPANAPQHVLLVKALESGGSVARTSNIFGTKISYSGGSVGTYALFSLDGELECSGNVYDYAGAISSKDFQKRVRAFVPDPAGQVIFQRGTCRAH